MAGDANGDTHGEVILVPTNDSMAADDYRWQEQVAGFYADLRAARVPMRQESTPVPGAKGEAEAVILALGSAGAFTAALSAFRAFLSRSRERSLDLWIRSGKASTRVTLKGDMDDATMERLAREALRQAAGD